MADVITRLWFDDEIRKETTISCSKMYCGTLWFDDEIRKETTAIEVSDSCCCCGLMMK